MSTYRFPRSQRSGRSATHRTAVAVTVTGGVLTTGLLFWMVRNTELNRFSGHLDNDAAARTTLIQRRLQECVVVTTALERLFTVMGPVTRSQFAQFVTPFVTSQPGLQAVEWIPAVPRQDRARFEAAGREAFGPGFRFFERGAGGRPTPAGERDVYYPVFYVEPIQGNQAAEGFDLGSNGARRAALERARDTGNPTATQRIRLVQRPTAAYGFLVFVPVFEGTRPSTPENRRAALRGFTLAVYDSSKLLQPLIDSKVTAGLDFDLLDLSAPQHEQLLYHWPPREAGRRTWFPWALAGHPEVVHEFEFAGRRWALKYVPNDAYLAREYPRRYWLLLPMGFLATLLIARSLRSILTRSARLEQEVAKRTDLLLQNEQTLRALLNATDDVVMLANTGGVILVANDTAARWLETPAAALEGAQALPLWANELGGATASGIATALASGQTVRFEHERSNRTFDTAVFPIAGADGGTIQYALYSRDVTERRKLEREVAAQRDFAYHVMNAMGQGLTVTNREGRFEFVNPAYARMAGRPAEELIGLKPTDVTAPENQDALAEAHAARLRGESTTYETRLLRGDGSNIRTLIVGVPLMHGGQYEGSIAVVTDLTERLDAEARLRASEYRYRSLAETAHDAIYIVGANLELEFVNPAGLRMLGRPAEEVIGRKLPEVFDPQSGGRMAENIGRVITTGLPLQLDEDLGSPAGRRWQNTWLVPLTNARGEVVGVQGVTRDLTDQRKAEDALRTSQRIETVGRLAGGVAHDLNNIFQALMSGSEALGRKGINGARFQTAVRDIQEYVRRGGMLTRQLLLFARSEPLRLETLDLNDLVRELLGMVRRLVPESIAFAIELVDRPVAVRGDGGQLEQVVMNLVINAADAMPEGGKVTVRTSVTDGMAVLEITDTGHGMAPDVMGRIFEPFFSTKEAHKGSGLGLSVVHGIVETHSGTVEVESVPGKGSTFRVLLPLAEPASFPSRSTSEPLATALPTGSGERVLLVEDEEGARRGLEEILSGIGYAVVAVGSGREAGSLPADRPFDVLLTDFRLPDVTGIDLATELEGRWPTLKVILMSGYAEDDAFRSGVVAGVMRFLQKPFDIASLAREIRAALNDPV